MSLLQFRFVAPVVAKVASLLRIKDHTQLDTQSFGFLWTSDQLVAEATTNTTHNKHKRQLSMPSARFESANPAIKIQTDALQHAVTKIGFLTFCYTQ